MGETGLRILGRISLLVVVMGFFMPVSCNLNGFQIAEFIPPLEAKISSVQVYTVSFLSLLSGLC